MLNVPSEIQTLLKRDSIFKNFHVYFPNGEHADLNNEDVLSETVSFTESICSQEAFRFGLTESSEIKFTCINVPNVRGITIECALEIEVTELGAQWIADHAPTGNESFLDLQVCTYDGRNMYRMPYGRFVVDKCPRNHESMWKREITAYTEKINNDTLNLYMTALMNSFHSGDEMSVWTPNVLPFSLSMIANNRNYETLLQEFGYEESQDWTVTIGSTGLVSKGYKNSAGQSVIVRCRLHTVACSLNSTTSKNALVTVGNITERNLDDMTADIAEILTTEFGVDAEQSGYASMSDLIEQTLYIGNYALNLDLFRTFRDFNFREAGTIHSTTISLDINNNTYVYIPYMNDVKGSVTYAYSFAFSAVGDTSPVYEANRYNEDVRNSIKLWDIPANSNQTLAGTTLEIKSTLNYYDTFIGANRYSFSNAISLQGIESGFLELFCKFGSPARTGGIEITSLDNASAVPLIPAEYSSLWYDETTIAPIGEVSVRYIDETGAEQETVATIGTGASVYDMRDNAVIGHMVLTLTDAEMAQEKTMADKVAEFLNDVFTPNIPDMSFVPIELQKKGLPYLEAGDALSISTYDGQTVPSFILRQTISGIQFINADVESANGEALGMVEV